MQAGVPRSQRRRCADLKDADWRKLWEERTGEAYPWPGRRKFHTGDSGVSGADTLPQGASTCDTHAEQIRYSDAGNALRLAKTCGDNIVYCVQADEYYIWDGTRWVRDLNSVNMLRMAKAVTERMFEEAKLLGDEEARSLRSHALKSQSASRLAAMVTLGKLHVRNVNRGDFDRDPWLFNCLNGTMDLKAGKLRPHDRNDLMSKKAPVKYDAAADCPLWKKCLSDWMLGDAEKAAYLQRQAGYAMTAQWQDQVLCHDLQRAGRWRIRQGSQL
jgi:putative DNA primase/helicase